MENYQKTNKIENENDQKKCIKCNCLLSETGNPPTLKTIKKHIPYYYFLDINVTPYYFCYECFKTEKLKKKRKAKLGEKISKHGFDVAFRRGDYKDFIQCIENVNDTVVKLNKQAEYHLQALKKIEKKRSFHKEAIDYAYVLAEDFPKILYPEARKEANRVISNPEIRRAVFRTHGIKCVHCGATEKIAIDHIVPVVLGGSNETSNLQPLCKSCNSKKGGSLSILTADQEGELWKNTLMTI